MTVVTSLPPEVLYAEYDREELFCAAAPPLEAR